LGGGGVRVLCVLFCNPRFVPAALGATLADSALARFAETYDESLRDTLSLKPTAGINASGDYSGFSRVLRTVYSNAMRDVLLRSVRAGDACNANGLILLVDVPWVLAVALSSSTTRSDDNATAVQDSQQQLMDALRILSGGSRRDSKDHAGLITNQEKQDEVSAARRLDFVAKDDTTAVVQSDSKGTKKLSSARRPSGAGIFAVLFRRLRRRQSDAVSTVADTEAPAGAAELSIEQSAPAPPPAPVPRHHVFQLFTETTNCSRLSPSAAASLAAMARENAAQSNGGTTSVKCVVELKEEEGDHDKKWVAFVRCSRGLIIGIPVKTQGAARPATLAAISRSLSHLDLGCRDDDSRSNNNANTGGPFDFVKFTEFVVAQQAMRGRG
jgi:hypothetical protein